MENPLQQYFRSPGAFIKLPSKGEFYKTPPKLSLDGELAVYPMTAEDEIWLKNPDTLLNGEGLKKIIKSCTPDIQDVDEVPIADADVILIGARLATYGEEFEVTSECPECKKSTDYTFKLTEILSNVKQIDKTPIVKIKELKVYLQPSRINIQTRISMASLEYQMMLRELDNTTIDSKKQLAIMTDYSVKLTKLNFENLRDGIIKVDLPDDNHVGTPEHILEWLRNITKPEYDKLQGALEELNKSGTDLTYDAECQGCKHKYKTAISSDPISFFA